jgi:aspartyl-tRNA(Asn)/glutamyl-tRNA(Gln) amidotransferase subunit A
MEGFSQASVVHLADLIRKRAISPVDLTQACLDSIDLTNRSISAFTEVYDEALVIARQLEKEAVRGEFRGPLHGIPMAVKDLFHVADYRNTRGSKLYQNEFSTETAPIVERTLAAGAILIGRTTTTEFGWKASSTSPLHGVARNPWDPSRTTGGSSSGSAAAVAAGMVPFSLGSDGGGSVRIPASFCGIFALKGSFGRIPTWPRSATEMLSHAGPMTQTALDSALLFDVLKGPDWRDPYSLPDDPRSYLELAAAPLPKPRIAFASTLFGVSVDPEVDRVVRNAITQISEAFDATIEEVQIPWEDPFPWFEALWIIGRGIVYGTAHREQLDAVDPGFAKLVLASNSSTAAEYMAALKGRAEFSQVAARTFRDFDLLLTPTVPVLPFAAEADGPDDWDPAVSPVAWAHWTPFTYPFNLTGQPAASLPCGLTTSGLPVGLQIVGHRHDDVSVLRFAAAIEDRLPLTPSNRSNRLPPIRWKKPTIRTSTPQQESKEII